MYIGKVRCHVFFLRVVLVNLELFDVYVVCKSVRVCACIFICVYLFSLSFYVYSLSASFAGGTGPLEVCWSTSCVYECARVRVCISIYMYTHIQILLRVVLVEMKFCDVYCVCISVHVCVCVFMCTCVHTHSFF